MRFATGCCLPSTTDKPTDGNKMVEWEDDPAAYSGRAIGLKTDDDFMVGQRYAGDRVLPVRIVTNDRTGTLVIRCVAPRCVDEWELPPYSSDDHTTVQRIAEDVLGHMATCHV